MKSDPKTTPVTLSCLSTATGFLLAQNCLHIISAPDKKGEKKDNLKIIFHVTS